MNAISELFEKGGPFFMINTFFLAVVLALIVERTMYFLGKGHLNAKSFLEQLKRLLAANNIDRAKKLCDATSAPVARVAKAGLNRAHRGEAAIAQAMEEAMGDAIPEVKTRVGALWSMANIATLTGLLGTITGLIATFAAVGNATAAEKQTDLTDGIAEAMYNTAYGLGIALLCMVAHLLLTAAMKRTIVDLEAFNLRFENLLAESANGAAPAGKASAPSDPDDSSDAE